MPDAEIEMTIAAELAGTGAPAWVAPLLRELRGMRADVADLTREVRGGGEGPGHAEQLRHIASRVDLLEAIVKWAVGIGTSVLLAVGVAWASFVTTSRPPTPHP